MQKNLLEPEVRKFSVEGRQEERKVSRSQVSGSVVLAISGLPFTGGLGAELQTVPLHTPALSLPQEAAWGWSSRLS